MEATKEDLIDLLVRTKKWMEELDDIGITNDDLFTDIENTLAITTKEELVSLYRHGFDIGVYNNMVIDLNTLLKIKQSWGK